MIPSLRKILKLSLILPALSLCLSPIDASADEYTSAGNGQWTNSSTWTAGSGYPSEVGDTANISHNITFNGTNIKGAVIDKINLSASRTLSVNNGGYLGANEVSNLGTIDLSGGYFGAGELEGNGYLRMSGDSSFVYTGGTSLAEINSANFKFSSVNIADSSLIGNNEINSLTMNGNGYIFGSVKSNTINVLGNNNNFNVILGTGENALTIKGGTIKGTDSSLKPENSVLVIASVDKLNYGEKSASITVKASTENATINSSGDLVIKDVWLITDSIDMNSDADNKNTLTVYNSWISGLDPTNTDFTAEYLNESDIKSGGDKDALITYPGAGLSYEETEWSGTSFKDDKNPGLKLVDTNKIRTGVLAEIDNVSRISLYNSVVEANVYGVESLSLSGKVNEISGYLCYDPTFDNAHISGYAGNTVNTELYLGGIQFEKDATFTVGSNLTLLVENLARKDGGAHTLDIFVNRGAEFGAGGVLNGSITFENGSVHRMAYSRLDATTVAYSGATIYVGVDKDGNTNRLATTGNISFAGTTNVKIVNSGGLNGSANLDRIFEAGGDITLGGSDIATGTVSSTSGVATISNGTGSTIAFSSNSSASGKVESVTFGDGAGTERISVSYTGTGVADNKFNRVEPDDPEPGPGPSPNPGPSKNPNTPNRLSIYNALPGSLQTVVDLGTDSEKATMLDELSPLMDSAAPQIIQRSVTRLLTSHYSRHRNMFDFESVNGFSTHAYPSADRVYLGQVKPVPCQQLWFTNYGDWTCEKGGYVDYNTGYYSHMYGMNVGVDRYLGSNWIGGVSLGGAWSSHHTRPKGAARGNISTLVSSAFASWTDYCNYFGTSIGYTYSAIRHQRNLPDFYEVAKSDHSGNQFFLSFEYARKIEFGYFYISPYYGIDFIHLCESGYNEKGAPTTGVSIDSRTNNSYLQNFGARIGTEVMIMDHWLLEPSFYGGWIHDFGGSHVRTVGSFMNGGVDRFAITGSKIHKNRGVLGLNMNVAFSNNISGSLKWDFEFNPDYNASNFEMGLRKVW